MIELKDVSKHFVINRQRAVIIDRVSFSVKEKEIFGLVGATGSGKSTLLRMMTGFLPPDAGEITLMGEPLTPETRQRLVRDTSMIFQGFHLLGNLNVLDNVLLPTRLRKGDREKNTKRARELLAFVGLSDHTRAAIRSLSGGQKQRVAIARALMTQPRVIFCDEPTSALDESMSYEVLKLLLEINASFGTTLVVVSHDISVIRALCNRVAILSRGKVETVLSRTPEALEPVDYEEALRDA